MTVINAMKINSKTGVIVTDEQASIGNRKVDASRKIFTISEKNPIIIGGGSGFANSNLKSISIAKKNNPETMNSEDVLNNFGQALKKVYTDKILGNLESQYNFNLENALTGLLNNGKQINYQHIDKFIQDFQRLKQEYQGSFILLSKSPEEDVDLVYVNSNDGLPDFQSHPYATTGSGSDISHAELIKYFSNINRDKREDISLEDGLSTLLYATYLSGKNNAGVGGIPEIAILDDDTIIKPTEIQCQLANEIATAEKKTLLRPEFMREALKEIIYNKNSFDTINESFKEEAKKLGNEKSLDLFLRGYRI